MDADRERLAVLRLTASALLVRRYLALPSPAFVARISLADPGEPADLRGLRLLRTVGLATATSSLVRPRSRWLHGMAAATGAAYEHQLRRALPEHRNDIGHLHQVMACAALPARRAGVNLRCCEVVVTMTYLQAVAAKLGGPSRAAWLESHSAAVVAPMELLGTNTGRRLARTSLARDVLPRALVATEAGAAGLLLGGTRARRTIASALCGFHAVSFLTLRISYSHLSGLLPVLFVLSDDQVHRVAAVVAPGPRRDGGGALSRT